VGERKRERGRRKRTKNLFCSKEPRGWVEHLGSAADENILIRKGLGKAS